MDTALPAVSNPAALAAAPPHGNGPKAARLGDPIEHSRALAGFIIGAVVGLAVGAAVVAATVATGGAALAVVAAVGTAAATTGGGALLGEAIGGLTTYQAGNIAPICSRNVLVNRKPAARAIVDGGACSKDGPPPQPIAQGSKTVMINRKPAARVGDRLVCDGKISDGSPNVRIGGETGTYLEITPEVPEWLHTGAEILMWTGTAVALVAGAAAATVGGGLCGLLTFGGRAILGLAGSLIGSELAAPIGRAIDGERGEVIARAIGGLLGGGLGARTKRGHPIDVATGEMFTGEIDFVIEGPLPLVWSRLWISSSSIDGALGHGWHHGYDMALLHCPEHGGWAARLADGRLAVFVDSAPGRPAPNTVEQLFLETDGHDYGLLDYDGLRYTFGQPDDATGLRYLTRISDPNGNAIEFRRGPRGRLDWIRDSAGRVFHVVNDDAGRITAIDAPHPDRVGETLRLVSYDYDAAGDLVAAHDARGASFGYRYDRHLMIEERRRGGLVFHFVWSEPTPDSTARCVDTWGIGPGGCDNLYRARLTYDLEAQETLVVNGRGAITRYRWNWLGLVDQEIDPLGGVTSFQWDEARRRLRVTEPDGATTSCDYDAFGRLVAQVDPAGGTHGFEYALHGAAGICHGNPSRIVDPDGAVHNFIYDARGNLAIYRDPMGHEQRFARDTRGLPLAVFDALGTVQRFTWSAEGDLLAEETGSDTFVGYEYDRLGRMVAMASGEDPPTRVSLDASGNMIEARDSDGSVIVLDHDAEDRLTSYRDALDRETRWRYDGLPVPVECVEADASAFRYAYDSELNLVGLTNAKGEHYILEYDLADRLVRETGFDGRRIEYRYDAASNLIEQRDEGRPTHFARDLLGRLNEKRFADGTTHRFAWDAAGRLTGADSPTRRLSFAYDVAGRLVSEHQDDHVLRHMYDPRGRLVQTILPDGRRVQMGYGGNNLLSTVSMDGVLLTRFRHDATGREIERRAGALRRIQEFDPQGRLARQRGFRWRTTGDLQPVFTRSYAWDANGGLTAVQDAWRGLKRYHSDARDRLLAIEGGAPEYFVVDPADNIVAASATPTSVIGDGAPGDRLAMIGDRHFTYDAHGNRVREMRSTSGTVSVDYRYGPDNQLIEVIETSQHATRWTRFTYDALGRRVSKASAVLPARATPANDDTATPLSAHSGGSLTVSDNTAVLPPAVGTVAPPTGIIWTDTRFLWDGDLLLAESVTDDPLATVYLYEPGTFHPLAQLRRAAADQPATVFHYHLDHLGTPQEMTNDNGEIVWAAELKAWGGLHRVLVDLVANPLRFPGQYHDSETGLHYNRFRYYSPAEGRFIQPDPIGLMGGNNLAAYAPHPAAWTDPLGLKRKRSPLDLDPNDPKHPRNRTHIAYVGQKRSGEGYSGYASAPGDMSGEQVLKRRYSGKKMNAFVRPPTVVYVGKGADAYHVARGYEHANRQAMAGDPDPTKKGKLPGAANRQRPIDPDQPHSPQHHRQHQSHVQRNYGACPN